MERLEFRPFNDGDRNCFSGADDFKDGEPPLICTQEAKEEYPARDIILDGHGASIYIDHDDQRLECADFLQMQDLLPRWELIKLVEAITRWEIIIQPEAE